MRRVMWRTDDEDLYQRVFEAAHDNRVSMNQFITETMRDKVGTGNPAPVLTREWLNAMDERLHTEAADQDKADARASLTHTTERSDA